MHSKLDFFAVQREIPTLGKFVALSTNMSYVEKIILAKRKVGGVTNIYLGQEITPEWIENNLQTMSLFSSTESFIVLHAEQLKGESVERLLALENNESLLFLSFHGVSSFFNKFKKHKDWECITVVAPPFWKEQELLMTFAQKYGVKLSDEATEFLLRAVDISVEKVEHLIGQIALFFVERLDQTLGVEDLQQIISPAKVDQFYLLDLLVKKNRAKFLFEVMSRKLNFKNLDDLFRMVCSHFLKLADTSYVAQKKKVTKFDRQIELDARRWTLSEIERVVVFFSEMQVLAREKNPDLLNRLKSLTLSAINH